MAKYWQKVSLKTKNFIINFNLIDFLKDSESAIKNVPNYRLRIGEHTEQAIHFFYKDSSLFSVTNDDEIEKLDFKGHKIFIYLHGGYWQWGKYTYITLKHIK